MAMCETAVSDGVAVTFWRATTPRLSLARPPSLGNTPWSKYRWMRSGLAPSSEIRTTFGDLDPCRWSSSRSSLASAGTDKLIANSGAATDTADMRRNIVLVGFDIDIEAPGFDAQCAQSIRSRAPTIHVA